MPEGVGLRGAVKDVARRAAGVVRLQVELAKVELASTAKNGGVGVGLAAGAAFIAVFAFGLLTALFVVALAIVLPAWLSILIILVAYLIVIGVLGLLARDRFNKVKGAPLAAEQGRLTIGALGLSRSEDGAESSSTALATSLHASTAPAPPAG